MRVKHLTRMGMVPQALDFILKENPDFGISKEDFEAAENTRTYDPEKGTTSKQYEKCCNAIDKYLDEHYLMYELDYTHPDSHASRDEVILVVRKPANDTYKDDFMFYTPDFTKDVVAMFVR